MARIDCCRFRL